MLQERSERSALDTSAETNGPGANDLGSVNPEAIDPKVVDRQALAALPAAVAQALADNEASLARVLQLLTRMEQEGTLQELADLLALAKLVRNALTDDMVIAAAHRVEGLMAVVTDPVLTALAGRLPAALRAAEADTAQRAAEPPSVMALVKQLRDPDVRRGLAFFLNLARRLAPPSASESQGGDIDPSVQTGPPIAGRTGGASEGFAKKAKN